MKGILLLVIGIQAFAGEYAVLLNGFRIEADSHQIRDDMALLHTGQGEISIPLEQIIRFEQGAPDPTPPATTKSTTAEPAKPVDVDRLLTAAARKRDIPPELVQSIAQVESGFRTTAVSSKGAIGLMQLMPATAKAQSADPHDVEQNAEAGANYLAELLQHYENQDYQVEKALAAYNAGPAAVDRYKGIPPYRETQAYVAKVKQNYHRRLKKRPRPANPR
ncbi:MAG: lytic transglycosylase domain-containing protein [Bryobacterales bacterium]|nr:lytic transglycosylase domain-containing protein [Bryobacterales bacterium]